MNDEEAEVIKYFLGEKKKLVCPDKINAKLYCRMLHGLDVYEKGLLAPPHLDKCKCYFISIPTRP